jgi:uncharacterized phage-like protein YoqJ
MIIAVTGHRPARLGGYGPVVSARLVEFAVEFVSQSTADRFITGMALGWDQAVAEACAMLKRPFVAAVPFYGQESKWPAESQYRYNRLLLCAERVEAISPGAYSSGKMIVRDHWMVDHSDQIAALWDGSPDGGTWRTVQYAKSRTPPKPIVNLWMSWQQRMHKLDLLEGKA